MKDHIPLADVPMPLMREVMKAHLQAEAGRVRQRERAGYKPPVPDCYLDPFRWCYVVTLPCDIFEREGIRNPPPGQVLAVHRRVLEVAGEEARKEHVRLHAVRTEVAARIARNNRRRFGP